MKKISGILSFVVAIFCLPAFSQPVGMEVGQVLIVNYPTVKNENDTSFKTVITEASRKWTKGKRGVSLAHFLADRGQSDGGHMLVCSINSIADRESFPPGTPFSAPK